MKIIVRLFVVAGALLLADYLNIIGVNGWKTALISTLILGLLSLIVKPIISLFTFPITVLTLGLFNFVINALIFWLISPLVDGFYVNGFVSALIGSIFVSIANLFVDSLVD